MVLNEMQIKAIEYTLKGMNCAEIAPLVGKDRTTVWRWTQSAEWRQALDQMQHEIKIQGERKILAELDTYIEELKKIALTDKSSKLRSDILQYLVDRVLGRSTSRIADVTDEEANKDKVSTEQLEDVFKKYEVITFEDEKNDSMKMSS